MTWGRFPNEECSETRLSLPPEKVLVLSDDDFKTFARDRDFVPPVYDQDYVVISMSDCWSDSSPHAVAFRENLNTDLKSGLYLRTRRTEGLRYVVYSSPEDFLQGASNDHWEAFKTLCQRLGAKECRMCEKSDILHGNTMQSGARFNVKDESVEVRAESTTDITNEMHFRQSYESYVKFRGSAPDLEESRKLIDAMGWGSNDYIWQLYERRKGDNLVKRERVVLSFNKDIKHSLNVMSGMKIPKIGNFEFRFKLKVEFSSKFSNYVEYEIIFEE